MSKELKLTVQEFISVNHYTKIRAFITYIKGKPKANAVKYVTAEAKKAKQRIINLTKKEAKKQGWVFSDSKFDHYYMNCTFYFPRIDMDDQNYYKIVTDAMNGIAFIDDSVVLVRTDRIYYDSTNPRIEITISRVEYRGIFENEQQLHIFENKCETCTRYKRNCSILKKAKEGRIQEELNEKTLECSKYKEVIK